MKEKTDSRLANRYINLGRWSAAGILLGIVLTIFGGYLSWRSERQATEDANGVAHTHAVIEALDGTLEHMAAVEGGARGFAATGEEIFLESVSSAMRAVHSDLDTLQRLTADNPAQQRRLRKLRQQMDDRLSIAREAITERQRTGTVPAAAIFLRAKLLTDEARATVAEMQGEESDLLDQRTKRSEAARRRTVSVTLYSTLSGILLLLVAGLVTRHEIVDSARMRSQLQAVNSELERRVTERASALEESQQRLQGIFDSALDAIIAVDEQRRIVLFNEAAQKTFRCSAAQATGRPIEDFIPARFHAEHAEHVRRFAGTGATSRSITGSGELGRYAPAARSSSSRLHSRRREFPGKGLSR